MKKFNLIFYSSLGICLLISILGFTSFDFAETNRAGDWTIKYFSLPILIVMAPTSYFIYLRFLKQYEARQYKSNLMTSARTVFRIVILTIALTGILYATTISTILITNASGDAKTLELHGTIVDYYTTRNRGRISHYIKIQDSQLDRILEMKVKHPFEMGQPINMKMKIGRWGLLYSEN
jgi:hypothetical protein